MYIQSLLIPYIIPSIYCQPPFHSGEPFSIHFFFPQWSMNPSGQLSLILRAPSKAIQAPNTSTQWSFSTQSAASLVLLASPLVDTSADQCRLPSLQPPLRSTPPPSANDSRRTRPERSLSLLFPPPRGRYETVIPPEKVSCMHACPWCPAVAVTFARSV